MKRRKERKKKYTWSCDLCRNTTQQISHVMVFFFTAADRCWDYLKYLFCTFWNKTLFLVDNAFSRYNFWGLPDFCFSVVRFFVQEFPYCDIRLELNPQIYFILFVLVFLLLSLRQIGKEEKITKQIGSNFLKLFCLHSGSKAFLYKQTIGFLQSIYNEF